MLMKVVVENGVKKLVPLTADAGSGNPCGTVITTLSNTVPSGYLPLGAQFDTTQFPVLYAILGSDTIPTASALGLPTLSAGRYVIKATSGINENQADNVLSALTPVDTVALNNLHSVTSNAVAQALNGLLRFEIIESESFTINAGSSLDVAVTIPQINGYSIGVAFYSRNQISNVLYSGKYIITIGDSSGTAWMFNPTNTDITTKIEVMVMYIKQIN